MGSAIVILCLLSGLSGCGLLLEPDPHAQGDDGGFDARIDTDAPIVTDGGPCDGGGATCTGGVSSRCVSGTLEVQTCRLGCSTTRPTRCAEVTPSNVAVPFDPGAPDVDLDEDATFDTDDCFRSGWTTQTAAQTTAGPEVCVVEANVFRIRPGRTLSVVGSRPLVVIANDNVRIEGVLDVSGYGTIPGPGGGDGGQESETRAGTGPSPGQPGEFMTDPADHGGGGGGLCGAGGRGGDAADSFGGDGGPRVTGWDLVPLQGGSGGGDGSNTGGEGGAGGGALQLTSRRAIRIDGRILAGGGAGQGGVAAADSGAGGGGGSGGAVLLEAPAFEIGSGALVRATGGAGGGASSQSVGDGSAGEDGALAPTSATGGPAAATDSAGDGGASGGGSMIDGQQGEDVTSNGGGGGGGAGCIVVATPSGSVPAGLATDSSPSVDPGLRAVRLTGD